jgi:predicted MPP superfamily phosphohydrolase
MRPFVLLILALIFLSNFVCWYALSSILLRLSAPVWFHTAVNLFILVQAGALAVMLGTRFLGHQIGTGMGRPLLALSMIWNMLLALPVAVVSLVWAVIWRLVDGPAVSLITIPWRTAGLVAVAFPFVLALIATIVSLGQLGRFRIHRVKLSIPGLPSALTGLTLVHLSDLHIGKLTRGPVLDDMVAATNALNPDLIVLTGDLINMSLEDLPRGFELLRAMKARYGLFLCEGNHDLIESRSAFEAAVQASGLPFLLNQSATIRVKDQTVQLLGLRWGDGMTRGQEAPGEVPADVLQQLLAQREPGDFTILLAHHPEAFDAAASAGIPLTLAGHTHGGQLMLTRRFGFGPWLYRYWSGIYEKGDSRLVVSNGAGNWFPLRLGAPAEIIHLTLE